MVKKHLYNYKMPTQCAPRPIGNCSCTDYFIGIYESIDKKSAMKKDIEAERCSPWVWMWTVISAPLVMGWI